MKKFFTRQIIIKSVEQCLKRFPVTVGFTVSLAVFLLVVCWGKDELFTERQTFTINYYLTVGSLLSLSLRLWGEEVKRKRIVYIANALLHLLLLADAGYLYLLPEDFPFLETGLAHGSALTALGLSIFTLPFFREKDDIPSWNFTLQLVSHAVTSWIIGGIMCGGLCLLTASFSGLFGWEVNSNFYTTWLIVFCLTLPSLLFLGQIPAGEAKHDRTGYTSAYLSKVIRYLFLPLLGCYLLVLYVYALKILVQWQLPNGWVSWLVIALTAGCIGVEFCMYPSLRQGLSRFEQRVARGLPIAILPLLVLMTIGIARRLNDYGITLNRLYLLTLNIWFYIVCIGLFVLRAQRIQWIAVSFAGIFLLTSVLPVNYARLTHRYMFQALSVQIQTSYKGELPMDEEQYLDWLASLPQETARLTNSRLKILDYTFKDKEIHRLVAPDINYWGAEKCIKENSEAHFSQKKNGTEVIAKGTYLHFEASSPSSVKMELNTGYSELVAYHKSEDSIPCKYWKEEVMPIELTDGHQVIDTIYVHPSNIRKWSAMDTIPPQKFTGRQKDNLFILTDFSLSGYAGDKNLNFIYSGYYFIQKKTN